MSPELAGRIRIHWTTREVLSTTVLSVLVKPFVSEPTLGVPTVFPVLVKKDAPVLLETWSFLQTKPWEGDQLVPISAPLSSVSWIRRIPWFICSQLGMELGRGDKLVWNPTARGPILGPFHTSLWSCEPNSLSLILSYQSNANKTGAHLPGPQAQCLCCFWDGAFHFFTLVMLRTEKIKLSPYIYKYT